MLAIIYLLLTFYVGDILCRRFLPFLSLHHRLAASFLAGALFSGWWTYLWSVVFSGTNSPLFFGNILFFLSAVAIIVWHHRAGWGRTAMYEGDRTPGSSAGDWTFITILFIVTIFLTFTTLASGDNIVQPTSRHWSDFGPNVGLMQTFVYGQNFPVDNPHFAGELVRHHFLFWFQAANVQYLGLNPALSINIVSILTIVPMLILVTVLGEVLFVSRVVGRIAASLFFFTGSLAFTTYFRSKESFLGALSEIPGLRLFVQSGYPYAGESWAIWTVDVFLQQRHFASGIGIFLIAFIFVCSRQRRWEEAKRALSKKVPHPAPSSAEAYSDELPEPESESVLEAEVELNDQVATERGEGVDIGTSHYDAPPISRESEHKLEPHPRTDFDLELGQVVEQEAQTEQEPLLEIGPMVPQEIDPVPVDHEVSNDEGSPSRDLNTAGVDEPTASDTAPPPEIDGPVETLVADSVEEPDWLNAADPAVSNDEDSDEKVTHYESHPWGYVFAGVLLGLLPHWHSAVFLSAAVILAVWFVLFPRRIQMLYLAAAAGLTSLPQILFIRAGGMSESGFPQFRFGYVVLDPTVEKVIEFLGFSLGVKWLFIAIALILAGWFHKRLFIAISSILAITFFVQISPELVAGHKFINIWLVMANVFVAYGVWRLWHLRILGQVVLSRALTIVLFVGVVTGGLMDVFPIWNEGRVTAAYKDDPLVEWLRKETDPRSVFLTHKFVSHPILMSGRKFYLGYTLYAWSAGLNLKDREVHYKRAFEERGPRALAQLLKEQGIDYVAIDNDLRMKKKEFYGFNEAIYKKYFEIVYDDTDKRYGLLTIYKVPSDPSALPQQDMIETPGEIEDSPFANLFEGSVGKKPGQFVNPRGLAVDRGGNIYIADSGNARIQKFNADGNFISAFGNSGPAEGELTEPNGIAINSGGDIVITDAVRHRLLLFNAGGTFVRELAAPSKSFFGPRDLAIGPDDHLYVLDQGNSRIVQLDGRLEFVSEWGSQGSGEGQFREPTGIEIGGDRIYVMDNLNNRIQVFDLNGMFIAAWPVPEWNSYPWQYPDAGYDPDDDRLYVTNPIAKQLLVFDRNGNRLPSIVPTLTNVLVNPSGVSVSVDKGRRRLLVLNAGSSKVSQFELGNTTTIQKK